MKKLSTYLFLILLSFSIPSYGDDIKEFEIEGISIGDSLLDYLSKKEIIEEIEILIRSNKDNPNCDEYWLAEVIRDVLKRHDV